jgi:hypothetical protein
VKEEFSSPVNLARTRHCLSSHTRHP